MNKKPGSYINEIMNDIEYNVLYKKLKNNKEDICNYIEKKYKSLWKEVYRYEEW